MSTYSYGNPPTNAVKLDNINDVLGALPDNTSKLISPKDVRDAVYTLWENTIFKTTTSGGPEYVGIDQDNLISKIYFGKKKVNGQFVLNNNLLSTDVDFFFYNNKTASGVHDTKVAFLAGTGSNFQNLQLSAPYLETSVVNNFPFGNTLDFQIRNSSYYTNGLTAYGGNISIYSENGYVLLNGVRYPTYLDNFDVTKQDYVLKYKYNLGTPLAVWEQQSTASLIDGLYSAGTVSIIGNPVVLNGLPIDFSYNIPTPVAIGGIPAGSTFSNVPLTEMIRRILYPYIAPEVTSTVTPTLVEIGDTNTAVNILQFDFTVYRNATFSISSITYFPTPPFVYINPASPLSPASIPNGLNTYSIRPSLNVTTGLIFGTEAYTYSEFSVALQDTYPTSIGSTSSLYVVLPWYYGTATVSATQTSGINNLNLILGSFSTPQLGKLTSVLYEPVLSATSSYNKIFELSTSGITTNYANEGYIYFGYPSVFPDLASIQDPNGYVITNSFKKFIITGINSPKSTWFNREYKFYIFVGSATGASSPLATTIGSTPLYNGTYKFNFA
jgi:hypothetical protein